MLLIIGATKRSEQRLRGYFEEAKFGGVWFGTFGGESHSFLAKYYVISVANIYFWEIP